jgi:hypothetical protein
MKFRNKISCALPVFLTVGMMASAFASDVSGNEGKHDNLDAEYAAKMETLLKDAESTKVENSVRSEYDLDVASNIVVGGTDEASKDFIQNVIPKLYDVAQLKEPSEKNVSSDFTAAYLDSKGLTLNEDLGVRIYFVGDTTSYKSTLGYSVNNESSITTLFDDATTLANFRGEGEDGSNKRTEKSPLQPGDFVDLGEFAAGTNLDFHLFSYLQGGRIMSYNSTELGLNLDGARHAMALATEGSSYLMIGFEDDKNASEGDFNDVVIAIQFYRAGSGGSSGGVVSTPEPSLAIGSLFSAGVLAFQRRRRA